MHAEIMKHLRLLLASLTCRHEKYYTAVLHKPAINSNTAYAIICSAVKAKGASVASWQTC